MITMEKWQQLMAEWSKVGEIYQIPRRSEFRLNHFCQHCVPLFKGKKVLEIGANAGIFGYCVAETAESYTAVEPALLVRDKTKKKPPKTDYFKQLELTATHIEQFNPSVKVFNETIPDYCKHHDPGINAFYACFALYHFMDHELACLSDVVFPKCDLVVIQNRNQDRPTPHNKYKFERDKNVVKFFAARGFGKAEIISAKGTDGKQAFSEIILTR